MRSGRTTTSWSTTRAIRSCRRNSRRTLGGSTAGRRPRRNSITAHRTGAHPFMLIPSAIITGLGLGSMYGLLALGFYVTYSISNTVNFAQGSTMMLGAVLCFTFWVTFGWPVSLAVVAALILCAAWGVFVERVAVRPFAKRGSDGWLMATVALGVVIDNVVLFTFGKDPRGMPIGPLVSETFMIGDIRVQPLQILIPVVGLGLAVALTLFSRGTRRSEEHTSELQSREN